MFNKLFLYIFLVKTVLFAAEITPPYASAIRQEGDPTLKDSRTGNIDQSISNPSEQPVYDPNLPTDIARNDDSRGYFYQNQQQLEPLAGYAPGYNYDPEFQRQEQQPGYNQFYPYYNPDQEVEESFYSSPMTMLWSSVPDARTIVNYVGKSAAWLFSSIIVMAIGALLTIAACTYTQVCTIQYNGNTFGLKEEMRSLMLTPERINHAADIVKTAVDKYQKMQKVYEKLRRR